MAKRKFRIIVTEDESADKIIKALNDNGGYCPYKVQRLPENKCMCKEFREQEEDGYCHCGLYYKEEI